MVRKVKFIDLFVDLVCPEVAIDNVFGHCDKVFLFNEMISYFYRKSIIKVSDAGLAHVFHFSASLAYLCFLVPCVVAGFPSENSEWSHTNFAFSCEFIFRHSNVWIFT